MSENATDETAGTSQGADRKKRLRLEDITVVDSALLKRAIGAAALGNAMEWFDFGVYAYIAVTLGKVFFPGSSSSAQLLATFGAFAAAFLVRPLGSMILGPLGDRIGRQKVLAWTMIVMAISTFCIGLIPSYESVGIWAPILLLALRMMQGFSTGGEYGGAATFIAEYSPDRQRGFMGSWLEFGTLGGYMLGAGVVTLVTSSLDEHSLLEWGWRIPFLVAGPLGIIGLYMRLRLEETPAFRQYAEGQQQEPTPKNKVVNVVTGYFKSILVCVGLTLMWNVCYYMLMSYMPSYLSANLHYDSSKALLLIIGVMLVMMCVQPIVGTLSDRIGRKPMIVAGCVAFFVLSIPCLWLVQSGSGWQIFLGLLLLGLSLNCFSGSLPATLPALFPTSIRYGALAIAFNVSVSLFAGTTPLVTAWLVDSTGDLMMPAYYMMLAVVIGIITVLFTVETAAKPLKGSTPAANDEAEARELLQEHHEYIKDQVEVLEERIETLQARVEELVYQHPELYKERQQK